MKIAVTSKGNELSSELDPKFGRAEKIIIYDLDTDNFELIDNSEILNMAGGAGIKTAEKISNLNPSAVITGDCGPKALNILEASNIKIIYSKVSTVTEAIEEYKEKNK